jgi:ATP-dependent RNA helicase RhlE
MKFEDLGLAESILRAVRGEEYHTATPIQWQAIPPLLAGRDLMGCAQTGTGKTAAFALPTLHLLGADSGPSANDGEKQPSKSHRGRGCRPVRSLILAPTRELAVQIGESIATYGRYTGLKSTVIYGGVGQGSQVRALQTGIDVLVATPGRLLDLMEQGYVDLSRVEILILDEADQMLDMGFIRPLRRIVAAVPKKRQTLMFSATMPSEIRRLANEWLHDPALVEVCPVATPVESVQQSVFFVETHNKSRLLTHFLQNTPHTRTLVFARTKHGADKIVKHLVKAGIRAVAIHGNKSQSVRQSVLQQFKSQQPPVLVATDIAARGLDIDDISHVINYELPELPEIYVHRIGRTARAGAAGIATSFCGTDEGERLRRIERLTRVKITVEQEQPLFPRIGLAAVSRKKAFNPKFGEGVLEPAASKNGSSSAREDFVELPRQEKKQPGKPARQNGASRQGSSNNGRSAGRGASSGSAIPAAAPRQRRRRSSSSGGGKRSSSSGQR